MSKSYIKIVATLVSLWALPALAFGQGFPAVFELGSLDGTNGFTIDLSQQTPNGVVPAGDFNGDGISDFMVGLPSFGTSALPGSGQIAVVFGNPGGFASPFALATLDGTNGFIINGVGNSAAGFNLGKAGDINGDGIDDVIIGAPFADPGFAQNGTFDEGSVFIVFGKQSAFQPRLELSGLNGTDGFVFNGTKTNSMLGLAISGAGDVNGDGINDVLIGNERFNSNNPGGSQGAAYIVFGKKTAFAAAMDASSLDGNNGFMTNSNEALGFGRNVSYAGDINKDGVDDLVFTATPSNNPSGNAIAFILYGKTTPFPALLTLSTQDNSAGFTLSGFPEGQSAGLAVNNAGDINNDGIDDLVFMVGNADPGGLNNAGTAYLVYGIAAPRPAILDVTTLDGSNGFTINGIESNSAIGLGIGNTAGDFNGDGIDDVIIGASLAAPNGKARAGTSYVIFGKSSAFPANFDLNTLDGSNGLVINGVAAGERSAAGVALGDVNNDGVDDVAIGGSGGRFASHVVYGRSTTKSLVSSVLPSARSGFTGGAAITVFATVINGGASAVQNCKVKIAGEAPVILGYQETDASNAPIGVADTPFSLAVGQARTFVLSFRPKSISIGKNIFPNFVCDNANVAAIPGVNTVFMSIGGVAGPDIISIGATPDGNGIITIPAGNISFMTASAINIGAGDAPGSQDTAMTVSVDDGGANLGLLIQLCEANSAATCITTLGIGDVSTTIGSGPSFFDVFISDQSTGGVPLDPANARVFLRFTDADGVVRSVTSAAVTVP